MANFATKSSFAATCFARRALGSLLAKSDSLTEQTSFAALIVALIIALNVIFCELPRLARPFFLDVKNNLLRT